MGDLNELTFLCHRLKELREKNNCTMDEMINRLAKIDPKFSGYNKSSISRLESGKTSEKTVKEFAEYYCKAFGMSANQTDQFLRGDKVAVPDTSALFKNTHLIDDLNMEYSKVVIPKIVVDELDKIKNNNSGSLGRKAWEVLRGISYGERTLSMDYTGEETEINSDCKIIYVAKAASDKFHCKVDIITEDTDYAAYLKEIKDEDGTIKSSVRALHLREYMATKQDLINMTKLLKIDNYYSESYDKCEIPDSSEINAYLPNGNTLLISVVRNKNESFERRKAKIIWLLDHGADINKRDNNGKYIPALSHAIQMNDYDMFIFLLNDCKANPNVGSRNPFDTSKVRQKNEGNMPLMIASFDGKKKFAKALCKDPRTSINQQDSNGFTALMKACMNGHIEDNKEKHTWDIRSDLLAANADEKIVDIDGRTANDWINHYQEYGAMKKKFNRNKKRK